MIKSLLEHNFVSHYRLSASVSVNVVSTNDANFDLKDDTVLVYPAGAGSAKFSNPAHKEVNIINYESFVNSLPVNFQQGREKCDLITYTSNFSHFILNELTNTNPRYIPDFNLTDGTPRIGKRNKAISQLRHSLSDISDVPDIETFIKRHSTKHCCFFNKQAHAPTGINAIVAFGRLNSLSPNGYRMPNPDIESFGFELWEFSGSQTYILV